MTRPTYEILALRYATMQERLQGENMIFPDDHAAAMPIDYFLWAIRGGGRTIVVDTGFGEAGVVRRGRTLLRHPLAALRAAGIAPESVQDVVISHLHWDHAGNLDGFPAAMFHLQDREMNFATGRCMCHALFRRPMDVEDTIAAVRHVYAERVRFHDGERDGGSEIAPGITLHLAAGHSGGLQVVRVPTARGFVVVASDAAHFYANIRGRNPFPLVVDVRDMLESWLLCERLADGPDHIIPGHDPEVLRRFPRVPGVADAVRVDLAPER
jgi:glyoxylase-like metal-dependent hydrolase (beta-lactamase superfamily II)